MEEATIKTRCSNVSCFLDVHDLGGAESRIYDHIIKCGREVFFSLRLHVDASMELVLLDMWTGVKVEINPQPKFRQVTQRR